MQEPLAGLMILARDECCSREVWMNVMLPKVLKNHWVCAFKTQKVIAVNVDVDS